MERLRQDLAAPAVQMTEDAAEKQWTWSMPVEQVRDLLRGAAQLVSSHTPSFTMAKEFRIRWKWLLRVVQLELQSNETFRAKAEIREDPQRGQVRRFSLKRLETWLLESFDTSTKVVIDEFCLWYREYNSHIGRYNAA